MQYKVQQLGKKNHNSKRLHVQTTNRPNSTILTDTRHCIESLVSYHTAMMCTHFTDRCDPVVAVVRTVVVVDSAALKRSGSTRLAVQPAVVAVDERR